MALFMTLILPNDIPGIYIVMPNIASRYVS